MGFGFGMGFRAFEVLFFLVFCLVLGTFLFVAVRGLSQWSKNNRSPRLTVNARVVAKRTHVSHHHHSGNTDFGGHYHVTTGYFVTFQVESGDRMELSVTGPEYGMLIEGDSGKLTFQGTRYLGFERT